MIKTLKVLIISIVLTIGSGCSVTIPIEPPLCLPERPVLVEVTLDEQQAISRDTLRKIGLNDLALKQYARQLEARISTHDEPLDAC
jgi:hypothetical protein